MKEFLSTEADRLIAMAIIILLSIVIGKLVQKVVIWIYFKLSDKKKVDAGRFYLYNSFIFIAIVFIGVSYAFSLDPKIESWTLSILGSAGIATIIVGISAQSVLSNFIAGFTIIIFRPFTVTHWIKIGEEHEGTVEEIKLMYTVIRERSNRRLVIGNSKILNNYILNSSFRNESVRKRVSFNINYKSDLQKAKNIIQEVAENHPLSIDVRTEKQKAAGDPMVQMRTIEFGEFAIKVTAFVWVANAIDARRVGWELNDPVKERFDQEGVSLHFIDPSVLMKKS